MHLNVHFYQMSCLQNDPNGWALFCTLNPQLASLTNIDYKILMKGPDEVTSHDKKDILPTIIHEDQSGFIKDRYIVENIRLIDDISYKLLKERKSAVLLLLDFERCRVFVYA